MKIAQYLSRERVVVLSSRTKKDALREMVAVLAAADVGVDQDTLEKAVWAREDLMSTGIGNSLAIPHVRLQGLRTAIMAVGVSGQGIQDYESLDSLPIQVVVLIAAPAGQHETYIRLLAMVAEVLKQADMRERIIASDEPEAIYRILTGAAP